MKAATVADPEQPARQRLTPPRTATNILTDWAAFALNVGVNFFLAPFIVHRLGNTDYGIWVLLASLVGYMGLLDLGVRSAVMRYVARHHARVEDGDAGKVASVGLTIFTIAGLVAIAGSSLLAVLLEHLFRIPAESLGVARLVVIIGGFGVAASLVSGVFGGIVAAMQRFDLQALLNVSVTILRAAAIVVALGAGAGLVGLALIQLATSLVMGSSQYALTRKLYPELRVRFWVLERTTMQKIFSFSIFSTVLYVSNQLIFSADSAVIGIFLPVAMVTFFAIGATLTDYTRTIVQTIAQTVTPRASALQAVGATGELERITLRAAGFANLVALALTTTFVLRGPAFIGLWMGPSYVATSGQILLVLSIALAFAAPRQVVQSAMIGMNRHRRLAPFYIAEGLINLGLSVYWIHSLGLLGVALGTAVPSLVTSMLVIPWAIHEALGTPFLGIVTRLWLRPMAGMVPFAAATWAVEHFWPAHGLLAFFAGVALALPVAALGAWTISLSAAERAAVRPTLTRLLHR